MIHASSGTAGICLGDHEIGQAPTIGDRAGDVVCSRGDEAETGSAAAWQAGFLEVGAFQGGKSLRFLHQLIRFSEELDVLL